MQTIYIDISNKGVIPTIYTKQGDIGRKFRVVFTDAGQAYTIPDGAMFSVWYDGDSGEGNYTDIGESSAFSIDGNKVNVEIISQMVGTPGSGVICLVMTKANGGQIGSWNIPYSCEEVPGIDSKVAEEYYTAFSKALEDLQGIADDLTPSAIGAAPAGYGLGESASRTENWNAARQNYFVRGNSNSPDKKMWYGIICRDSANSSTTSEIAFSVEAGNTVTETRRARSASGVWGEWEYVNPPMTEGVEYRTTERFNEKPVYAQLVNCGTLPNTSYKEYIVTSETKANILDTVRMDGYISISGSAEKVPIWVVSDVDFRFYGNNRLRITTTGDKSYLSAYVAVYYTLSE